MFRHILINNFLEHSAKKFPDKTAIVHKDERLTYAEIDSMANKLASALIREGIEKDERVAVFMDNSIEAIVSIFAVLKTGAAFIMINHTIKSEKLEYIMNDSKARGILTQGNIAGVLKNIECPHLTTIVIAGSHSSGLQCTAYEDIMAFGKNETVVSGCIDLDLALIIYTSGSTGKPKGVMLSHRNMVTAAFSITTYIENTEDDIIINVLPLSFDYGLYQVLMGFKMGGTIVLEKSFAFPYVVVEKMISEKVTGFPGVPTIFAILLQMKDADKYDFSSVKYITNTAAALPVSHIKKLRELFPQARIYSMYGLTECKRVSFLPPEEIDSRPTSVGRGMPNQEVYIVNENDKKVGPGEVGELVVRGGNVMIGYWGLPKETAKCLRPGKHHGEKVLYTGDLFRMDEDGYLYFVARKDDIIKSRGEKVSPKEIENVLYGLDGILEAAVVGVPDEILGESIKAYIALEKGSGLTEKDILKYCSQHLETMMIPKYIEIRGYLPKTATGKISKTLLSASNSQETR